MIPDTIENWTKFAFDQMRRQKVIMPTIMGQILKSDDFKNSGITEDQLRESSKERFSRERQVLVNKLKDLVKKEEKSKGSRNNKKDDDQ